MFAIALAACAPCQEARAYVEAPHSLGKIVASSTTIVMVRVKAVDREKNTIIYTKVRDIRGTFEGEIKHVIGQRGFHPREWKTVMAWARVGKQALFFTNGGHGEMCIDNYWYQAGFKGWSTMTHAEPYFLRAFAGRPAKLATYVTAMLAGQEVIVPCLVDGDKMAIQTRTAKVQRLRASLKIGDYDQKRDFVGWGAEEFRPIAGMPGFTHYSGIGKFSPGAGRVAPADFNGDGKTDLFVFGDYKMSLLKNDGGILGEETLPVRGGARAAVWGDYDSDGKIDLFVASSGGAKLLRNNTKQFTDATADLPLDTYNNPRAAVWIDYDGDKKLDLLLADGFRGLRLYRNTIPKGQTATAPAKPERKPLFVDVSDAVGLGEAGIGASAKGDHLAIADVNRDGRMDVLYSAGTGMLLLNTAKGFVVSKDSGINYIPGRTAPIFGDYNRDGHPDLFIAQKGKCKLLKNDGRGRFTDVTGASGDLAATIGWAGAAAWVDFDKNGRLDLFVGCLKGPNRYFSGQADGTFKDETEAIGLMYHMYNTCGVGIADINSDDMPDLVFNNEGQAAVALLGNPSWALETPKTASTPPAAPITSAVTSTPTAAADQPAVKTAVKTAVTTAAPTDVNEKSGASILYWLIAVLAASIVIGLVVFRVVRHTRAHLAAAGLSENESHQRSKGLV
jgi:hypothetical protein